MKNTLDETAFAISDGARVYYGADQHWFKNRLHGLSGCGPAAAALITLYMASVFEGCRPLYRFPLPASKKDFAAHMSEVREFVKPGLSGLTDAGFFAGSAQSFAAQRGVAITPRRVKESSGVRAAFAEIAQAIDGRLMPALLILKNPSPEIDDFTWHWMAVTGYDDERMDITISTYARKHTLSFEKVWIQNKPYSSEAVYFLPG